jgi:sensor histidine kinase regulating citrate/malate metabolism
MLERIFFHDILNTAGNLKMISEMLLSNGDEIEREHLIAILSKVSTELVDEIEAQKQLYAAETGSLRLNNTELTTHEIFSTIIDQFNTDHHRNQVLRIGDGSTDTAFVSDRSLLVRIIKNMVKNALEASGENDTITLLSKKEGNILRFEVKNPAFISRDVQLQIFKRSFSTKSLDRGLGTYSMKILGENYLKGRVYFTSSEKKGTIFFFDLPLSTESTLPA